MHTKYLFEYLGGQTNGRPGINGRLMVLKLFGNIDYELVAFDLREDLIGIQQRLFGFHKSREYGDTLNRPI
jgi:hypothetical protein